jgi:hypothetical protein
MTNKYQVRPKCLLCGDYHFPSEPHKGIDYDLGYRPPPRPKRPGPRPAATAKKLEDVDA